MILKVAISADALVPQADPAGASAVLVAITADSWNSPNIVYVLLLVCEGTLKQALRHKGVEGVDV
jgi:hypothetical protein